MRTEKHAAVVRPAAPAAQHRHTTAVEAVSDALVGAALKESALQADRKKKERNEGEGKLLS